jgi:hypothetical protein
MFIRYGDWAKAARLLKQGPAIIEEAGRKALKQEAEFFRTKIVQGIRDQEPGGKHFKPLSPKTIAVRRFLGFDGTKALMRSGYLRNSITVTNRGNDFFTGMLRSAKSKGGQSMVNIAELQENGSRPILIKMTPPMMRLLAAAFRAAGLTAPEPSGAGATRILIVQIPARPFIGPVFDKYGPISVARPRMEERLRQILIGRFAK